MTLDNSVWYGIPSSRARREVEVALGDPQVDSPGLVERIAGRKLCRLHLTLSPGSSRQLAPLEMLQNLPFFGV